MPKTYIIAEAGVNHNGSFERAIEMIHCAKQMGADAIKFQLFQAENLTTQQAEQAQYQKKAYSQVKTQYEMLKELELSFAHFEALKVIAEKEEIDFIITPFDLESLRFIVDDLNLSMIKIGSGDITNGPMLLACGRSHREIILSTGMSTLADIENALQVIAFGLLEKGAYPTKDSLAEVYASQAAQDILKEKVTLLHCTSEYPAPFEDVNLKAMDTMAHAFGLAVGFSDHTPGIEASLAAVAREACVIEKHFTLDKSLSGPDHLASLDPSEFQTMINGVRKIEAALGNGHKRPTVSESKNMKIVRRAIVANQKIVRGEEFTSHNLGLKRPYVGLSPMHYWDFLGKKAERDYAKDEVIGND